MKVKLICTTCETACELDEEASDASVGLSAFCLLWMRGEACRCAGYALDAPPAPKSPTRLEVVR